MCFTPWLGGGGKINLGMYTYLLFQEKDLHMVKTDHHLARVGHLLDHHVAVFVVDYHLGVLKDQQQLAHYRARRQEPLLLGNRGTVYYCIHKDVNLYDRHPS